MPFGGSLAVSLSGPLCKSGEGLRPGPLGVLWPIPAISLHWNSEAEEQTGRQWLGRGAQIQGEDLIHLRWSEHLIRMPPEQLPLEVVQVGSNGRGSGVG